MNNEKCKRKWKVIPFSFPIIISFVTVLPYFYHVYSLSSKRGKKEVYLLLANKVFYEYDARELSLNKITYVVYQLDGRGRTVIGKRI